MPRNTVITYFETVPATIAAGQSLSPTLDLGGLRLAGLIMPTTWTAAPLTFQVSIDGGTTFVDLFDPLGGEYTVSADANTAVVLEANDFTMWPALRLRSGTRLAPIPQAALRTVTVVLGKRE